MIKTGYYTIEDIKSFFIGKSDIDDLEEGDTFAIQISDNPPVDIVVEIIEIDEEFFVCEVVEINGHTNEYEEGDVTLFPKEIFYD